MAMDVWGVVLLNVTSLVSLTLFPAGASLGLSTLFWDLAGVLGTILPAAYSVQHLLQECPSVYTLYDAVAHAGGETAGKFVVVCEWVNGMSFSVTMLQFTALALAEALTHLGLPVSEDFATSGWYLASAVVAQMVLLTGLQMQNLDETMRWLLFLAAAGVLLPLVTLVVGSVTHGTMPPMHPHNTEGFFQPAAAAVMCGFGGIEVAAFHAKDSSPAAYQAAIGISAFLTIVMYALGQVSIAALVPQGEIDMSRGAIQALRVATGGSDIMFAANCVLAAVGGLASALPWLHGPIQGMAQLAGQKEKTMIILQNAFGACLGVIFLCTPSSAAFWWLLSISACMTQSLYLVIYVSCLVGKRRGRGDVLILIGILTSSCGLLLDLRPPDGTGIKTKAFTPLILGVLSLVCLAAWAVPSKRAGCTPLILGAPEPLRANSPLTADFTRNEAFQA
mmetsp:Transcript_64073/g.115275  ORF Transcript_64073/g.115275 Transcript_64073/m.115275 type:complete len:448 (+) Transcript_64073:43-1386(+)